MYLSFLFAVPLGPHMRRSKIIELGSNISAHQGAIMKQKERERKISFHLFQPFSHAFM